MSLFASDDYIAAKVYRKTIELTDLTTVNVQPFTGISPETGLARNDYIALGVTHHIYCDIISRNIYTPHVYDYIRVYNSDNAIYDGYYTVLQIADKWQASSIDISYMHFATVYLGEQLPNDTNLEDNSSNIMIGLP